MDAQTKRQARIRRHAARAQAGQRARAERPRLAVYRSNRHIYAQLVDDVAGADARGGVGRRGRDGDKTARRAKAVGKTLAERAKDAGIERAVFDRGGRLYHGRVAGPGRRSP